ncbi:DUF3953 domain-containing protein [Bacillus carboniphilus]|uniref:DUF3953 domain-containing protein n=1 Tax=Bacillus carboniphilus TaxID=86663 RepID=UPI003531F800
MEETCLLTFLRIVFSIIVVTLALSVRIINNSNLIPYILLSMAAMMFLAGISEQKEKRWGLAILSYCSSGFVLYVSVSLIV